MYASSIGNFSPARFNPAVNVTDEGSHLAVSAELPGIGPDDIQVTAANGVLTLQGEKRHQDESREDGVYRIERSYGRFSRSLPLPPDVVADAADGDPPG